MRLSVILLCLIIAIPSFAGKVITYTATSKVSQEDANNMAMAGVAKQIVSQVSTDQTLGKSETIKDGNTNFVETFSDITNVTSDLKLKGITVVPAKTDGKSFKATATLDMDELTADIQFQMKGIKQEIAHRETAAANAIKNHLYSDAAAEILTAEGLVPQYEKLVQKLGTIYPINESHRLTHNIPELHKNLVDKLSTIKITGPAAVITLKSDAPLEWNIQVVDNEGLVAKFPLVANQGRNTLAQKRTDANGIAQFSVAKTDRSQGKNSINIIPDIPLGFLKEAGIGEALTISYTVEVSKCNIQLECTQSKSFCSALKNILQKKNIFAGNEAGAPRVQAQYTATEKNTLNVGSSTMKSYNVEVSFQGASIDFTTSAKGVGNDESSAVAASLKQMKLDALQSQLKCP
ncbi:MAG: hypothetical protein MJY47_04050 [Fibrobacter sp.]|nr:hypothetical protein [Fibrobacter sp.]